MKPYYSWDLAGSRGNPKEAPKTRENLSGTGCRADEILSFVCFAQFIFQLGRQTGVVFVRPDSEEFVAKEASQFIIVNRFAIILDGYLGAFHNRFSSL